MIGYKHRYTLFVISTDVGQFVDFTNERVRDVVPGGWVSGCQFCRA